MCLTHDMSIPYEMHNTPGLHCYDNGQIGLSGDMLNIWQILDQTIVAWAEQINAREHLFPPMIAASELQKIEYFDSFPHLATFAITLKPTTPNLCAFRDQAVLDKEGAVQLTQTDAVKNVLTPAACYHFYIHYQNTALEGPLYLTTRCTCHRREEHYKPLQRQWTFNMRELVCIGTEQEVDHFLAQHQQKITNLVDQLGIQAHWQTATDPFFMPEQSEKHMAQRLFPIKQELVLENGLAIASVNRHYQHFGSHYKIRRDAQSAFSGCVAFGLERWVYAMMQASQT